MGLLRKIFSLCIRTQKIFSYLHTEGLFTELEVSARLMLCRSGAGTRAAVTSLPET